MIKKILKWIVLLLCWLTLSPLVLYLGHRWKMGGKYGRIVGMLLSPLFLILYVVLFFVCIICYERYSRIHSFQDRDRIERITGVRIPEFKVLEYNEGETSFTYDYNDSFTFEFKTTPSDDLFNKIDKMIEGGKTQWRRDGKEYTFDCFWGNGFPAPKGEDENDDISFSITITRGKKQGVIQHGMW